MGLDFLHKHGIVLDFTTTPVTIHNQTQQDDVPTEFQPMLDAPKSVSRNVCAVTSIDKSVEDTIDNCAFPLFHAVDT